MAETYYEMLGVSADASTDEIEAAYRERLKETHPDVSDDADASDRTKQLIEAKDVLTEEDERSRYDRLGHEAYVDDAASARASSPTTAEGTSNAGGRSAPSESWTRATTPSEETDNESTAESRQERRRRYNNQAPRDSWSSDTGTVGHGQTRSAWETTGSTGQNSGRKSVFGQLVPSGQGWILLAATFACYPILLWGALFQRFPLSVNAVIGGCLLVLVAYMQSVPDIGVLVYGTWTLLLPVGLYAAGISLSAPLMLIAVGATGLSLGFTLLTRAVMRS